MGRECAPLVALAHLEGQSRRLPPWLSRPALGGTPPLDGGWPSSRTAIAQPPKGFELCAVPRSRMFSAWGLFCGCASHSAVILLLLPADAIRILVRLRLLPRAAGGRPAAGGRRGPAPRRALPPTLSFHTGSDHSAPRSTPAGGRHRRETKRVRVAASSHVSACEAVRMEGFYSRVCVGDGGVSLSLSAAQQPCAATAGQQRHILLTRRVPCGRDQRCLLRPRRASAAPSPRPGLHGHVPAFDLYTGLCSPLDAPHGSVSCYAGAAQPTGAWFHGATGQLRTDAPTAADVASADPSYLCESRSGRWLHAPHALCLRAAYRLAPSVGGGRCAPHRRAARAWLLRPRAGQLPSPDRPGRQPRVHSHSAGRLDCGARRRGHGCRPHRRPRFGAVLGWHRQLL
jgi:hypothetical protein